MMDIASLAGDLTAFPAPFLPYLWKAEEAKEHLQRQLRAIPTEDRALAEEVARLWREAQKGQTAISPGPRSGAIAGDATGNTIITGDRNRLI